MAQALLNNLNIVQDNSYITKNKFDLQNTAKDFIYII